MAIWRVHVDGRPVLARGPAETGPEEVLAHPGDLGDLLGAGPGAFAAVAAGPAAGPVPPDARILVPVDRQEIWAAGVTYARSREARMEESASPDPYDRVYHADRPELFVKACPGRARGTGEAVAVRADSEWDVPEPELALLVDHHGAVVGYLNGNDVSSRSIEGENPLYLPQAKVYRGSCAVGPCVVPVGEAPAPVDMRIRLAVTRAGSTILDETVEVSDLRRSPEDLVSWLFRALDFPAGVVVLTGTAIVPSPEFSLRSGDEVSVATTGLGELRNSVEVAGPPERST